MNYGEELKRWAEIAGYLKPLVPAEPLAFVSEAGAELARLIDDVQKNRNRPEVEDA